jgi:hypothetical protein
MGSVPDEIETFELEGTAFTLAASPDLPSYSEVSYVFRCGKEPPDV